MFTGLVEDVGVVQKSASGRLAVRTALTGLKIGDSIAVNGACLTIRQITKDVPEFDLLDYTLRDTALAELTAGAKVNLERAVAADGRFGGHLVSGHIDEAGVVQSFTADALTIQVRPENKIYLAVKGSVAVNGVSLTIQAVTDSSFTVGLIDHTRQNTMLGDLTAGAKVNIEYDLLIRYLQNLLPAADKKSLRRFLF